MVCVMHMCFLLSHTSTNTNFLPKPQTTFLTRFSRGQRRKYARKKFRLSNSQPPGHESGTLITEPLGQGNLYRSKLKAFADDKINEYEQSKFALGSVENTVGKEENAGFQHFLLLPQCIIKLSVSRLLKVRIVW